MNDPTLQQHPDFVLRRSAARSVVFGVLAVAALVALVLSIVFYGQLAADSMEEGLPTRRGAFAPLVAPGAVVLSAFATFLFGWLALSGASQWQRVSTGARLRGFELRVAGDAAAAAELHRRFATGDPAVYLPVPVDKRGAVRLRVYRADADRRAFVTVQHGTGSAMQHWPLIELKDRGYVQIKRRGVDGYAQQHIATGGSIDPELRS